MSDTTKTADTPAPKAKTFARRSPVVQWTGSGDDRRAETLEEIADRLGVDADELFAANRGVIGSDPANVAAGMVLAVPS